MANLLPNSLKQEHIKVYDDLAAGRYDVLPVDKTLVYLIDTVDANALPILAEQFDILGIKGYGFATTEQEKRDVIRNAIELHRYKGTVWAIKEALRKIGLIVLRIDEGDDINAIIYYNGAIDYDGTQTYGSGGHWAFFRVVFDPMVNPYPTPELLAVATAIINEYKNVRSHLFDILFELDTDAQAFLLAIGNSDAVIQNAINQLVLDLKAASLWTKMQAIYPLVGGTATAHKFNLKNPVDSDAAFRLVFAGGWTHSATGALSNGVNGYADTKYIPATHGGSASSIHMSYFSRQNTSGAFLEMGVAGNSGLGTNVGQLYIAPNLSGSTYIAVNMSGNQVISGLNTQGYFVTARTDASNMQLYKNGALVTNATGTPNSASNYPIFLGGRNNNGTADVFTNRECAFATIGDGLNGTEVAALNTIIQAFQTTLSR